MFGNDCGFRSRILGAAGSLGGSVLFTPRDFWFEAVLGVGFGGLAVLVGGFGVVPKHVESDAWSWDSGNLGIPC